MPILSRGFFVFLRKGGFLTGENPSFKKGSPPRPLSQELLYGLIFSQSGRSRAGVSGSKPSPTGMLRVPMRRSFDSAFGFVFGFAQDDSCLFAGLTKDCEGRLSGGSKPPPYGDVARSYAEILRLRLRLRSG